MAEVLQLEFHLNGLWYSVVASPCALHRVHSQLLPHRVHCTLCSQLLPLRVHSTLCTVSCCHTGCTAHCAQSVVASPCALHIVHSQLLPHHVHCTLCSQLLPHSVHSQFLLLRPMRWFSCCLGEIVKNLAKLLKILCGKSEYFCEGFIS
jgi:hypothetical protein